MRTCEIRELSAFALLAAACGGTSATGDGGGSDAGGDATTAGEGPAGDAGGGVGIGQEGGAAGDGSSVGDAGSGETGADASAPCAPPMGPDCSTLTCVMIPVGADSATVNSIIQSNPAGTVFGFPAGTWHQVQLTEKANDQFIGDPSGGTILTGDHVGLYSAFDTSNPADGIVVRKVTVEHYGKPSGDGSECNPVEAGVWQGGPTGVYAANGWTVDHVTSIDNSCDGLSYMSNVQVIGGHFNSNGHAGIEGGSSAVIEGAEIAFNNTENDDPGNDAAGLKLCGHSDVKLLYNYVHDNNATGLWGDCGSAHWTIDGNTVVNNKHNGIQYEISTDAVISNNVVNGNGSETSEMQIYVSSSGGVQVYGNNVLAPGPAHSILFQDDNRASPVVQNVTVHDNVVTFTSAAPVAGWWNTSGSLGSGNAFDTDHYYVADLTESHWAWGSFTVMDWSTYRSTSGQDAHGTLQVGNGSVAGRTDGCRAIP